MSILKRLILNEWYKVFMASVAILFVLISVANLISGFLRGNVTPIEVLFNHLLELPSFFTQIFPVSCLVASLFSINKLKNRNELTAIFASGFSRRVYIFTVFQASLMVAILYFLTSGYLQPFAKQHRFTLIENAQSKFRNLKSQGLKASTIGSGKLWYKSGDYFVSFAKFDKTKNILNDVNLYILSKEHKLKQKVQADMLLHFKNNEWEIINGKYFNELGEKSFPQIEYEARSVIKLNETPSDFKQLESDITTLDVVELWGYISQLKSSGINVSEYMVLFLDNFSGAFICIIFALISTTPVFTPNRRNSSLGKNLVLIFAFTLCYWLVYSYCIELGKTAKINPYLATFSVPTAFGIFLVVYFFLNRKLK